MSTLNGVRGLIYATKLIDAKTGESKDVGDIISGAESGGTVTWADVKDKPAVISAGKDQAEARNAIGAGTSDLTIGTSGTSAMAGNKTPTATQRGGVLQQAAIADLTAAPTQEDFNALLSALRSAGILAS